METLERFQQNQRIIEDFTSRTLMAIRSEYGRLIHISLLRDLSTGQYQHDGLATLYSAPAVQEALNYCHEELFMRILETPLEQQESDLRISLSGMQGSLAETAAMWLELDFHRLLVPLGVPGYLRDLFSSNLRVLLQLIVTGQTSLVPAA
jgi:hypothetical protein